MIRDKFLEILDFAYVSHKLLLRVLTATEEPKLGNLGTANYAIVEVEMFDS